MSKILIIGAGETALLAYEYFTFDSEHEVICFATDREYIKSEEVNGIPVIPIDEISKKYPPTKYQTFVAFSAAKLNRNRRAGYEKIKAMGYKCVSYISSKAFVWKNVKIGENCMILENNVLQPFVKVGNNVVLWSGNHIGHRVIINDHCFISSHCVISGFCEIGNSSFLGVNCTIEDEVNIGADCFIGASALIQKNSNQNILFQEKQTEQSRVSTHKLFKIK